MITKQDGPKFHDDDGDRAIMEYNYSTLLVLMLTLKHFVFLD